MTAAAICANLEIACPRRSTSWGGKAGSRLTFVQSGVGVAVRTGAPKPDISTPARF
jgi:hypothetical protein